MFRNWEKGLNILKTHTHTHAKDTAVERSHSENLLGGLYSKDLLYPNKNEWINEWSLTNNNLLSAIRKIQSHNSIMRFQHPSVCSKICGTPGVRLHIHAPLMRVETKHLQRPLLAKCLNFINKLITPIVSGIRNKSYLLII